MLYGKEDLLKANGTNNKSKESTDTKERLAFTGSAFGNGEASVTFFPPL